MAGEQGRRVFSVSYEAGSRNCETWRDGIFIGATEMPSGYRWGSKSLFEDHLCDLSHSGWHLASLRQMEVVASGVQPGELRIDKLECVAIASAETRLRP